VNRATRIITGGLVALAIASRMAAVWVLQSHHVPRSTYEHGEIAANLLADKGFTTRFLGAVGPTSQQAPIYPGLVACAYALAGVETPQALLLLELGQSILGGVLVLGVMNLARSITPERPGIAFTAGLAAALHPTLVYAATHVQVALLGTTLLIWTLAAAYRTGRTRSLRDAALTGLLLALLTLTDPILALVFPGVAWAVYAPWTGHVARRRSFALVSVIAITASVGIAPWLVRNGRVHGELVAIKSTFGYAFWQGNCSVSEGTDKVVRRSVQEALDRSQSAPGFEGLNRKLWEARHEAGYIDDIALSKQDYLVLGRVSEPERSRILFRRAIAELESNPGRYVHLCLQRLRYFILFDETNPKSRVMAYRIPHLTLSLFGVLGLFLVRSSVRMRLMPTIATAALIAVFHTLTIVSARFHIPIEPLLGLWGAAGLVHVIESRQPARIRVRLITAPQSLSPPSVIP
jgi:4-amino-4-deoxy-L-arabinose transferase-like glycosyltransferase